ncbi:MAG: Fic family protein [Candidatus Thermoplasmatota archaeon]|nr:Fic family protein [Candidatus Thermoplasmatota archaeon]
MDRSILNSLRERLLDRGSLRNLPERTLMESIILNTWGTNSLEGNTLTLNEVTRVIETGITVPNRPVKDLMETVQLSAALEEVIRGKLSEVNMEDALNLHEMIFHRILPDAGRWRTVNVKISGSKHSPPRVEKLLTLLKVWEKQYVEMEMARRDVFYQAAQMHFGLESIHPFSDGNGRVGRLLLNMHFLNHNWPLVHILPHDRNVYMDALESAHTGGVEKLTEFLKTNMAGSLLFALDLAGSEEDRLLTLNEALGAFHKDYSAKYLALRIKQGELPGIMINSRWMTSLTALRLYGEIKGRV